MRYSCEEGHDYAEGYSACETDSGGVGGVGVVLGLFGGEEGAMGEGERWEGRRAEEGGGVGEEAVQTSRSRVLFRLCFRMYISGVLLAPARFGLVWSQAFICIDWFYECNATYLVKSKQTINKHGKHGVGCRVPETFYLIAV